MSLFLWCSVYSSASLFQLVGSERRDVKLSISFSKHEQLFQPNIIESAFCRHDAVAIGFSFRNILRN